MYSLVYTSNNNKYKKKKMSEIKISQFKSKVLNVKIKDRTSVLYWSRDRL